jgi:dTDP-4-dehydrorhamnose reductase
MKIALTGATGLVGSRFFDLLKSRYEIVPLSSSFGVDITDRNKVRRFLGDANPALIVHLAAKTNVDACEEDKSSDLQKLEKDKVLQNGKLSLENLDFTSWKGSKSAFGINVVGTKNLSDYAAEKSLKMIYVSTDFVFDGESNRPYTEEDKPNPIDWYGHTKFWGEQAIAGNGLIARISYPYGFKSNIKKDIIWILAELLSEKDSVQLVIDQIITPTFIDDIVHAIDFLIDKNAQGLFNIVGNNFLSPYEIGIAIAREFGLRELKIETTTRAKLYRGRAPRPFKVELKNDKIKDLGFKMTDFFDVLKKIK